MRRKEKLYCDECGTFVRDLSGKELRKTDQERFKGTRVNHSIICKKCEEKKKRRKNEILNY